LSTAASCPARVCLGGEDLDWIGGHTVQLAIERRTVVTASLQRTVQMEDRRGQLQVHDLNGADARFPAAAVRRVERDAGALSGRVEIASQIPLSRGLASSAAVLMATLAAASTETGLPWAPTELMRIAYEVEMELTDGCVGPMDPIACGSGGLTCLVFSGSGVERVAVDVRPEIELIVALSGIQHETAASINRKRERLRNRDPAIMRYISTVDAASRRMIEMLTTEPIDLERVGDLIFDCHRALSRDMGVSSAGLDEVVECARDAGALGAKLCGSGEGGSVVALASPGKGHRVETELARLGLETFRVAPAWGGLA
jgi:mevalonate kinase